MSEFYKYQHIERYGTDETEGIDIGTCWVFPKIDGTNGSVWIEGDQVRAGSRNRELTLDNDNHGFCAWVLKQEKIISFLIANPDVRLFGEWLVPHTLKTYTDTAWHRFYVFDVWQNGGHISYERYALMLVALGIDIIPPICKVDNPTYDQLIAQLDKATFLIEDGKGTGEGIVIKNYGYYNKYGRKTWAKIVRNEFKAEFGKATPTEMKGKKQVEDEISRKYVTPAIVDKVYAKITESVGWQSKDIPRLLNTVYHDIVTEETWNIVKQYKNPAIDFSKLLRFVILEIKKLRPELF